MKIFMNPGHSLGGEPDPGAVNPENGMRECDIAMTIGSLAAEYLEKSGCDVYLLQSNNLMGEAKGQNVTASANEWGANLFLSIHCNAADGRARGAETLCYWRASEAGRLAARIQKQLVDTLQAIDQAFPDRGVKERQDLAVLRETCMPAVLVETAFIDNMPDAWLLANYGDDIARAIARGVTDYLSE